VVRVEEVWIPCSGVPCHGLLYLPERPRGPGVVMAMGFGMVKEAHADDYAPYMARNGITVLAFDYRRFGKSRGEPRQALYPMDQVADYRCAINWLRRREGVDPDKVCVWGTSFSGGHTITLTAFPQPGVACGIAQVPNVYSYKTALEYFGTLEPILQLAETGRQACCEGKPQYISIVSEQGEPALLVTEEARQYYLEKAKSLPTFQNRITMDSIDRILAYNPGDYAHLVSRPILMITASRDKTTPPSLAREVFQRVPAPGSRLVEYEAGHFDLYKPPLLEEARELMTRWILQTLGVE